MSQRGWSRRGFIKRSIGAAAAVAAVQMRGSRFARGAEEKRNAIRFGGPVNAGSDDPEKIALAHREKGYRAAFCPNVGLKDADRIRAIREAFAKHDVAIAEVGRWVNLLDADPQKRKANLDAVTEGLALADAVGARCCVDIAGSFNEKSWFGPHPKNFSREFFDAAVENARTIIDAVKPKAAKFCYEMMGWAYPDSADMYLKMLKAIDRPGFGVHLDPCNAVNSPERFYRNADLLNELFDKLGPHIASVHAKDLTWDVEMNVHFREVIPGTGAIDYRTWLARQAQLPGNPPLMMEHLKNAEEYEQGRKYIMDVGKEIGVGFE